MKKILVLVFFNLFIFSCKDNNVAVLDTNSFKEKDSHLKSDIKNEFILKSEIQTSDNIQDCKKILTDFVKSSSLKNPFKESLTIEIEELNDMSIKIMLYEESNVVGTIIFDAKNYKLLDLTNNEENPEELNFDIKKWDIIIDCYFKKNKKYYINNFSKKINPQKEDCVTKNVDMSSDVICKFKNTTNKLIYEQIIDTKLVENANTLLKIIPSKNLIQKIGKNGLISNNYLVKQNFVQVEMNYEGGITSISLEQKGSEVIRTITTSAD